MDSDSIADRLAAEAGRSPRTRARTTLTVALVPALAALVWASGAVVPRLGYGDDGGEDSREITSETYITARVDESFVNNGWMPVTVTGVGVRGHGVVLRRVRPLEGRFPRAVGPGELLRLVLDLDVEDCAAVRARPPEVVFEVSRWWGSQAVTVSPEEPDGPQGGYAVESACDS
ncbi:hypothetical protein [Nonomuraea roseoviolacea]|uniref:Uncharacterized protein n=1 Tax=Nonomuraea roseoviolacea subsp. carminata TaxID=160689 RepID=A0ABT1JWA2_9ACTN|nr:hypothetical protein [Nonomuraea roseoviolacea]MCP2346033.1 hypothetical protein [Nonomuraea roseoviolacea subsp. carminata]